MVSKKRRRIQTVSHYCRHSFDTEVKYSHNDYKGFEMVVNVADAKSKFSSLLILAGLGREEVIISKRNKPTAVLISYETFLKMKRRDEAVIDKTILNSLPSSLDQFYRNHLRR